jgi:hypothetical protein
MLKYKALTDEEASKEKITTPPVLLKSMNNALSGMNQMLEQIKHVLAESKGGVIPLDFSKRLINISGSGIHFDDEEYWESYYMFIISYAKLRAMLDLRINERQNVTNVKDNSKYIRQLGEYDTKYQSIQNDMNIQRDFWNMIRETSYSVWYKQYDALWKEMKEKGYNTGFSKANNTKQLTNATYTKRQHNFFMKGNKAFRDRHGMGLGNNNSKRQFWQNVKGNDEGSVPGTPGSGSRAEGDELEEAEAEVAATPPAQLPAYAQTVARKIALIEAQLAKQGQVPDPGTPPPNSGESKSGGSRKIYSLGRMAKSRMTRTRGKSRKMRVTRKMRGGMNKMMGGANGMNKEMKGGMEKMKGGAEKMMGGMEKMMGGMEKMIGGGGSHYGFGRK